MSLDALPEQPQISKKDFEACRESGDFTSILYEWYKFVGQLCAVIAHIMPDTTGLRSIQPINYAVLTGLLNRCSRLMLANLALSQNGSFGETTSIIDRCIFESSIKIIWLCKDNSEDFFNRFIADGLKAELILKAKINNNILARGNRQYCIEKRMLDSIKRKISSSQLSEEKIKSIKKLPPLSKMIDDISNEDILYIVGQIIGSQHVHGTWSSLLLHYIELNEEGLYSPRAHNCETHINQYVFISKIVLLAMKSFVEYVFNGHDTGKLLIKLTESTKEVIDKIYKEVLGADFEYLPERQQ